MNKKKKLKVTIQGADIIDLLTFNVVKIGEIEISEKGIVEGLRLGIVDKYGIQDDLPSFEVLFCHKISDKLTSSVRTVVYIFTFREYLEGSEPYETFISGTATFSQRQERNWKGAAQ